MASVVLNGNTYTDDANATTGLAGGGHRVRFVPALSDMVAELQSIPARLTATSGTTLTIGTGSKAFTINATNKAFAVGQYVIAYQTSTPTNYMIGQVTAFTVGSTTSTLTINVASATDTNGSGTIAAWTISISAPRGATGTAGGITGGNATGAINETAVTLASAATTDIGAAAGNAIRVTGTTTITALGTAQSGAQRTVTFSGALALTHNATSLILPGAANIITTAGDVAIFESLGAGNWRCASYQRASGAALVSPPDNRALITGLILAL